MTKKQIFERIQLTAKHGEANVNQTVEHINQMDDPEVQVMAEAMLTAGACIADMLTNLVIILCEMLPEEGNP